MNSLPEFVHVSSEQEDTLVIDVETKYSFAEVGGEQHIHKLGISVAGVYSYATDTFSAFEEHELSKLEKMLQRSAHMIGFNINHFDIPVMQAYIPASVFSHVAVTDLFTDAVAFLGHRVGLDALSRATLGVKKSGHGLEALRWFREGRIEEVKRYCLDDVRITRDLYEYGKEKGHVLFESFADHKVHSIPVPWGMGISPAVANVVRDAFHARKRMRIEYISSEDREGRGYRKARLIDVYRMKENGNIEAYCHLRGAVTTFRLSRIQRAEITEEKYTVPQEAQQPALF
ncbi:MAG: DEAD/DEAH box helicase domain-containing protein [Parcubacteria group bacterium Gr01-1014_66]|nr:MAG: DEAD/DEAH box helicase domain-containing protein [Parcubacteria group bacterium Gr01-1014_66]